jgi:hypothetical protein
MTTNQFQCDGSSVLSPTCNKKRKEILFSQLFDEQLQFVNANDMLLKNMKYVLSLEDGSTITGITDNLGRTKRIQTVAPVAIKKAQLQSVPPNISSRPASAASTAHSCTYHPLAEPDFLVMELSGIKTSSFKFGTSVVPVKTPEKISRSLTSGEIEIAFELYSDSIDYTKVKVHNGDYLWFGQDKNTAMTPEGEMYFPTHRFKEDFSKSSPLDRHWFIHEMAHVWQFQIGYNVWKRGLRFWSLPYEYVLDKSKLLSDYNMEAQGDILADYWSLVDGKKRELEDIYMEMEQYRDSLELYKIVLRQFFEDRRSWKNWPKK